MTAPRSPDEAWRDGWEAAKAQAAKQLADTREPIEWFNNEINGVPTVVKGERDFVRLSELRRFIAAEAARIAAMEPPK